VDVRQLKREGLIAPQQAQLVTAEGAHLPLVWTACNLGGSRPWFGCPGSPGIRCGRRAAILYLEGATFSVGDVSTSIIRVSGRTSSAGPGGALKARARLAAPAEQLVTAKPKQMHKQTFLKCASAYLHAYMPTTSTPLAPMCGLVSFLESTPLATSYTSHSCTGRV
jgi:hypothetical protein